MNKAVFIDRDGTVNFNKDGYVHKKEDFEFIPKAVDALKLLSQSDYKIIILTNQSGIGRGYYTEKEMHLLHDYMLRELKKQDVRIDALYYCPHNPDEKCSCRKPATGMAEKAEKDFNLDLTTCIVIGDKTADIKLGENIKAKTVLVKTGKARTDKEHNVKPTYTAKDLHDAAQWVLKHG